jgi:putative phosphoribosyl transferase
MKEGAFIKHDVRISSGAIYIDGTLTVPDKAIGLIIFAHGSGSSRFSPRNNYVAKQLNRAGFATLLLDLLLPVEDQDLENRFNISLLSSRLAAAVIWATTVELLSRLPIGLFGESTGAAAMIDLAGKKDFDLRGRIDALVSRGGRPDLAPQDCIKNVNAATLFLVGQNDEPVISYNKRVYNQMHCTKSMEIIEGASHLFEEPGTLELVAEKALKWFKKNLHPKSAHAS